MIEINLIRIKMPDGSSWEVSLENLKTAYAINKLGIDKFMSMCGKDATEALKIESSTFDGKTSEEAFEIIRSQLGWEAVRNYAHCIELPREADYEKGWKEGAVKVITVPINSLGIALQNIIKGSYAEEN